ncbi:MAG: nucleotide exchange factor GrpE [Caldilineales bacterium]|nr:nucleotide exchange factor GrpE [Caldilineales bacterium]
MSETETPIIEIEETAAAGEQPQDAVIAELVTELTNAKRTADEAQDQALRAQAELQNFRRRKERETEERVSNANASLLKDILPVLDDFERAVANAPAGLPVDEGSWADGFLLIQRKLQALLEKSGVSAIPSEGDFDPNLHEAISVEPSETVGSGEIIAEVRRGYMLNGRVLRPSQVRVAL